jgi:tripartite-type tricarboxylate transporter receptor subunit TctC
MKHRFALVIVTLVACIALSAPLSAAQETFPSRDINLVVTYSPGGGFDTIARAIARSMTKGMPKGLNVIVKNITGAAGVRGTTALYRSKSDGHTIGHLDVQGLIGHQLLRGNVGYDMGKMTWLARVGFEPVGIMVNAKSRYHTVDDLRKAKTLKWGVFAIGGPIWQQSFVTAKALGIPFSGVVSGYRGNTETIPALLRGDFDAIATVPVSPAVLPLLRSKELRVPVVLGTTRYDALPDVPTAQEAAGTDFLIGVIRAIAAPPGVPEDRVKVLERLLVNAMADVDYQNFVKGSGQPLVPGNAAETKELVALAQGTVEKYSKAMAKALER